MEPPQETNNRSRIRTKEMKSALDRATFTPMLIETQLTITKIWNQHGHKPVTG